MIRNLGPPFATRDDIGYAIYKVRSSLLAMKTLGWTPRLDLSRFRRIAMPLRALLLSLPCDERRRASELNSRMESMKRHFRDIKERRDRMREF